MVLQSLDTTANHRFVLRPNRSLTWKQAKRFFALVASVVCFVAGSFAVLGYWPVLPFAGLELLVLWIGLWMCATSGEAVEVVSIEDSTVTVEKGTQTPRRVWQAPRAWAQVRLTRSARTWYPSRLTLRSHGREVALGEFLVEEERHELAEKLSALIGKRADTRPTGS